MKKRIVQTYNSRAGIYVLFDRLKLKALDWQYEEYNGVPRLTVPCRKTNIQ